MIKCVLSVSIGEIWDEKNGNVGKKITTIRSREKFNNILQKFVEKQN